MLWTERKKRNIQVSIDIRYVQSSSDLEEGEPPPKKRVCQLYSV